MIKSLGFALLAGLAFGCGSSSSPAKPADAGGDTGITGDSGAVDAALDGTGPSGIHGQTVDYNSKKGVSGAMIAAAGMTATSDAMGNWSLTPALGQPFSLAFTKSGYIPLTEQEMSINGDFDQGGETLIDTATAMLFLSTFKTTPDPNKGIVNINVIPTGSCTDAGGATITLIVPGATGDGGGYTLEYWKGGFPNAGTTSVQSGQSPVALAYDLPTGVNISITVQHPTCTQMPYPVTQGNVTYTGNVQVIAGTATSYIRAFLK
jgi:hypothetical protein